MPVGKLFPPGVGFAVADAADFSAELFPVEAACIARAVPKRRSEFAAGRACARRAMMEIGGSAQALPAGSDRAPVWPDGIVGSISHCDGMCAAVAARRGDGFAALGLDIEPRLELDADLLDIVCSEREIAWLSALPKRDSGVMSRAMFCAKEAVFKAQYPLSHAMIDFHAVTVDIDVPGGAFLATFIADAHPFHAGDRLSGRLHMDGDFILAGLAIRGVSSSAARSELALCA